MLISYVYKEQRWSLSRKVLMMQNTDFCEKFTSVLAFLSLFFSQTVFSVSIIRVLWQLIGNVTNIWVGTAQ